MESLREILLVQMTYVSQNRFLTACNTPLKKKKIMEVQSLASGKAVIKATCTALLHHPHVSALGNNVLLPAP